MFIIQLNNATLISGKIGEYAFVYMVKSGLLTLQKSNSPAKTLRLTSNLSAPTLRRGLISLTR